MTDRTTDAELRSAAVEMANRIANAMWEKWRRRNHDGDYSPMRAEDLPPDLRAEVMVHTHHVYLWVETPVRLGYVELLVVSHDGSAAVIRPMMGSSNRYLSDDDRWNGLRVYDPDEVERWQTDPLWRDEVPKWWAAALQCIAGGGAVTEPNVVDDSWL